MNNQSKSDSSFERQGQVAKLTKIIIMLLMVIKNKTDKMPTLRILISGKQNKHL